MSQADAALSELSGLGRYLPNPDLLIGPYVKREALASSRIEGTRAELSELLFDEIEPGRTPPEGDILEVRNYIAALNTGIRKLDTLPMAGRLIREMHAILMKNVRGHEKSPGEFRRSQNWIGPPGGTLANALYVPPPPEEMQESLKHWEIYLNERGDIPDLIQCADPRAFRNNSSIPGWQRTHRASAHHPVSDRAKTTEQTASLSIELLRTA